MSCGTKPKYIIKPVLGSSTSVEGGLPIGGVAGQYLRKLSGANYDATWTNILLSEISGVTISTTEINRLSGVTGNIQAQLDGKQSVITGGATTILTTNLTANRALLSDANGKVAVSVVTSTELSRLSGVTSNVQTQLNTRLVGSDTSTVLQNPSSSENGYAITWDNTNSRFTLSSAVGLQPLGVNNEIQVKDGDNLAAGGVTITKPSTSRRSLTPITDTDNAILDLYGKGTGTGIKVRVIRANSANNTSLSAFSVVGKLPATTAANGFGVGMDFQTTDVDETNFSTVAAIRTVRRSGVPTGTYDLDIYATSGVGGSPSLIHYFTLGREGILRNTGSFPIVGSDGSGTNSAGGTLIIKGGRSTGNAEGGAIFFQTAPAGSSGSSLNNWTDRMRITSDGSIVQLANNRGYYFGDIDIDGSWRFIRSGNNLLAQRRESGVYETKKLISPDALTGTDFNAFTEAGVYFLQKTGASNGPAASADYCLTVFKESSSSIGQLAVACFEVSGGAAGNTYTRRWNGSTWTSWSLINSGD